MHRQTSVLVVTGGFLRMAHQCRQAMRTAPWLRSCPRTASLMLSVALIFFESEQVQETPAKALSHLSSSTQVHRRSMAHFLGQSGIDANAVATIKCFRHRT